MQQLCTQLCTKVRNYFRTFVGPTEVAMATEVLPEVRKYESTKVRKYEIKYCRATYVYN